MGGKTNGREDKWAGVCVTHISKNSAGVMHPKDAVLTCIKFAYMLARECEEFLLPFASGRRQTPRCASAPSHRHPRACACMAPHPYSSATPRSIRSRRASACRYRSRTPQATAAAATHRRRGVRTRTRCAYHSPRRLRTPPSYQRVSRSRRHGHGTRSAASDRHRAPATQKSGGASECALRDKQTASVMTQGWFGR